MGCTFRGEIVVGNGVGKSETVNVPLAVGNKKVHKGRRPAVGVQEEEECWRWVNGSLLGSYEAFTWG